MKKKIRIYSTIIIGIILLFIIGYFIILFLSINIKLNGKSTIKIEVNNKYKEPGITITGPQNIYKTIGKVDATKVDTYTLTYTVKKSIISKSVKRKVIVVDTTKPEITLTAGDISIYINDEYQEPGFVATDNYDGNLTEKVKITNNVNSNQAGEYEIIYTVKDSNKNKTTVKRKVTVNERINVVNGMTYITGILLVNKQYSLPSTYNPGADSEALAALKELQRGAATAGHTIPLISGFRSYSNQQTIYNNYVQMDGQAKADTYSARPGHSEHQSGLAFDIGKIDDYYGSTPAGIWLQNNAHLYGFIIRYPQGKSHITGYKYEPWHVRYVGNPHATNIYNQNVTLEEYLKVA